MTNHPRHRETISRRESLLGALGLLGGAALTGCHESRDASAKLPAELRVDWAYYSPLSIVVRQKKWLEERFPGLPVRWVLSLGSNKALELLGSEGLDFGSTAGGAALLSRANGNPIRAVYIYSRPEWVALVVGKDSKVRSANELRGKKIAATKGTDAHLFLLRILRDAGIGKRDFDLVHLQHPDGRAALERGDVDAWAGLDPHMAASELEQGSRLIVRKREYNTDGFLDVRDAFAQKYPEAVRGVLETYERARKWAIANPQELATSFAAEAKLSPEVAQRVLARHDFHEPRPGPAQITALRAVAPLLIDEQLVRAGADVDRATAELLDTKSAEGIVG